VARKALLNRSFLLFCLKNPEVFCSRVNLATEMPSGRWKIEVSGVVEVETNPTDSSLAEKPSRNSADRGQLGERDAEWILRQALAGVGEIGKGVDDKTLVLQTDKLQGT
jgi:hypothetical protein